MISVERKVSHSVIIIIIILFCTFYWQTSRYPSFALGVALKPPVVRFRNRRVIAVTASQQATSSNQINPVGIIFFHRSFVSSIFWMYPVLAVQLIATDI